jgi:D-3-phosphoglycerate dehydrogenase
MVKVLIGPAPLAKDHGLFYQLLTAEKFELYYPAKPVQMVEEELLAILPGAKAVVAGSEPYTARVLEAAAAKGLKVVARAGVGFDSVDVAAATRLGIAVTITPGTNHDGVAEHTFALILALAKRVVSQHDAIRAGGWPRKPNVPLRGQTLGLVGLGRIGKSMTTRALAFGLKVIAHEVYPDEAFVQQHGIELVPLDRLFAEADYVSLHAPMTPETHHMVNARTLGLMKPTAYLINTARGGLVDEPALAEALAAGRIAGAGLDVFDEEPPGDNPLCKLPNLVATAHTAGIDAKSLADMASCAATAIVRISRGDWPAEWVVNPDVRERCRW